MWALGGAASPVLGVHIAGGLRTSQRGLENGIISLAGTVEKSIHRWSLTVYENSGEGNSALKEGGSQMWVHKCKHWTIKKAEHQRNDAFPLWCWRRHFRVTWTARRSNQSILKEISPEYSLEELTL